MKYVIIGAVAIVAFFALHLFGVFSSVATAPGRVINKTMETNNIISNYEWYHDTHAAYRARLAQVQQFKTIFNTETDAKEKSRLRIELAAMQQSCRDLVTKYNANSTKTNRVIFRGKEAPESLPENSCE